jgi:hypothetical protein
VGFDKNRKVMIKIEETLKCYEPNVYSDATTLFPEEYKNLDREKTSHFISLYQWIWTIVAVLIFLIWLRPVLNIITQVIYNK